MTHKNPELRAGSVVKAKESSPKPKTTPSYGKAVSVYIGVEALLEWRRFVIAVLMFRWPQTSRADLS